MKKIIKRYIAFLVMCFMIINVVTLNASAEIQLAKPVDESEIALRPDFYEPPESYVDNGVATISSTGDYRAWAQGDSRWGSIRLGSSSYTVANSGCLVTSVTKLIIQAGLKNANNFNVATFVNEMNNRGGFTSSGDMYWGTPGNFISGFSNYGNLVTGGSHSSSGYNSQIISWINSGYHLVLNVNNGGHWIAVDEAKTLATGQVYIMDSLSGSANADITLTSRYSTFGTVHAYKGGSIPALDTIPPTISNVRVTDVSNTGYTVTCDVSDNVGVTSVQFPTWPYPDGSWQPVWHQGTISGNTATCRINVSDHGNIVNTNYATHIYAYDAAGNSATNGTDWIYIDGTVPKVINVEVSDVSETGYTITCTVTDASGVAKVLFPTWTHYNGQDDLGGEWKANPRYVGTINGDKVTYRVNISDHNNESGLYYTHIYAYDTVGNELSGLRTAVTLDGKVYEPLKTVTYGNNKYEIYSLPVDEQLKSNLSQWAGVKTYCESLGGHLAVFETPEEWAYIKSQLDVSVDGYWLGATDEVTEGTWKWVNGQTVNFGDWAPGQPDNYTFTDGVQQHYLVTRYEGFVWDDDSYYPRTQSYGFVCEYEIKESTISFDANGGEGAPAAQTKTPEDDLTLSSTIPTRFGWNFKGWSTSSAAAQADYQPGDIYTADESVTLYAVWEQVTASLRSEYHADTVISYPDNGVYYKIVPEVTANYRFRSTGDLDTKGYLYDSNGAQLAVNDDGEEDLNFELTYQLEKGKTYYIYARLYGSNSTGTFETDMYRGYIISYDTNGGKETFTDEEFYTYYIDYDLSEWSNVKTPTRDGYTFVEWNIAKDGSGAAFDLNNLRARWCAYLLQNGKGTLYAIWEKDEIEDVYVNPFSDVSDNAWYASAVQYVYENGIMSGNNGLFNPTGNITRAQVVATLYKLEGSPKVTDDSAVTDMPDVEAGQWYTDAVCWAYSVGVANGNSVTKKFNLNDPVTRQQLATFFYNYAKYKGLDTTTRGDISGMAGADQVASYALDTVKWAVGTGLITGSETTVNGVTVKDLKPTGTATRAQMASILMKFCEKNGL